MIEVNMTEQKNKSSKTWYNRFEMMTLFHFYNELKKVYNIDGEIDLSGKYLNVKDLNEITSEKLGFGLESLAMHLRSLYRRHFILISDIDGGDIKIEDIFDKKIELTVLGRSVVYLLKDIKYQSIYKSKKIKYKNKETSVIEKHSRTFYNRHSLYLLMSIFNNGLNEYKIDKEKGVVDGDFNDYIMSTYSINDILEICQYGEKSTVLHLDYLLNKGLVIKVEDDLYALTEKGVLVSRLLKDIKYQSIYNLNKLRLV